MERSGQEFMEFAKQAFQATLDAASKVQKQTQQLMEELVRQGAAAQEGGKRVLTDWMEQSRRHMEEFRRAAIEGYRKWEEEVTKRLSTVAPATKPEVEDLRRKVDELTRKLGALEKRQSRLSVSRTSHPVRKGGRRTGRGGQGMKGTG